MRVSISGNATSRLNEAVQSDSRRSDQGTTSSPETCWRCAPRCGPKRSSSTSV